MSRSELAYGAFLAYCPRGDDELHKASRRWRDALKNDAIVGNPPKAMTRLVADRMCASLAGTALEGFFTSRTVIVPVPGSSVPQPNQLWVPKRIAEALVEAGIGANVWCCLNRVKRVRKSSNSAPADRPRALEHLESFTVELGLHAPDEIVLVDDVVTRGATLMAAAMKLDARYPKTRIRGFAVMRAVSEPAEFVAIRSPVVARFVWPSQAIAFDDPEGIARIVASPPANSSVASVKPRARSLARTDSGESRSLE